MATLFQFMVVFGFSWCHGNDNDDNNVPIIGIVTVPAGSPVNYSWLATAPGFIDGHTTSAIVGDYITWVRNGGAEFIPIVYDDPWSDIQKLIPQLNGIVFQGDFGYPQSNQLYYIVLGKILNLLREYALQNRDTYQSIPLWAICLGFESLVYFTSINYMTILTRFDSSHYMASIEYTKYALDESRVFHQDYIPQLYANMVIDYSSNDNRTYNDHSWGVAVDAFYNDPYLNGNFSLLGYSVDRQNKPFVTFIESKTLEIDGYDIQLSWYATQFHPELGYQFPEWSWPPDSTHTVQNTIINSYFAQFFVNECRLRNNNKMDKEIYDNYMTTEYKSYFLGINAGLHQMIPFNVAYWFPQ